MPDLSLADLARNLDEQFMEQDRLRSQGIPNFDRMPLKFNPQAFQSWLSDLAPSQNIEDRRGEPQPTDPLNPMVGSVRQILLDQMPGGPNRHTGQMSQLGQPAQPRFYGPGPPRPFLGQ